MRFTEECDPQKMRPGDYPTLSQKLVLQLSSELQAVKTELGDVVDWECQAEALAYFQEHGVEAAIGRVTGMRTDRGADFAGRTPCDRDFFLRENVVGMEFVWHSARGPVDFVLMHVQGNGNDVVELLTEEGVVITAPHGEIWG